MKKIKASILGATGYTGAELLKILLRHPHVEIRHATSESSAGKRADVVHPSLKGLCPLVLEKPDLKKIAVDSSVAFLALPGGQSPRIAAGLTAKGCRVIDLSPDFRLDIHTYHKFYQPRHAAPHLLKEAFYGLPELIPFFKTKKISESKIVANPGCYATAAILALAPLIQGGLVNADSIIVDAKSGISGAGKKLELMYNFSEANENMTPYAVARHRHMPEMEAILTGISGRETFITFVPQLAPMTRGILSLSYANLKKRFNLGDVTKYFARFYNGKPFVRLLEHGEMPQTKSVLHTNFCDIGIAWDKRTRTVIVASALDNLIKGASGQAVQNMNLMFGLNETEGLL